MLRLAPRSRWWREHKAATETETWARTGANPEAAHYTILAAPILQSELDATNNDKALALLEKALDLDPNWVPALLSYVVAQIAEVIHGWSPRDEHGSRLGKAQDAVDRAVKLAPRNSIAYHRRARPLRTRGDLDGAIAANAHALALNPNLAEAHTELARSKIDTGLAHEDEARALIKEHLSDGNGLTISRWIKRFPPRGGVVAEQRARIVGLLRGPGVPEGKIQTGSVK